MTLEKMVPYNQMKSQQLPPFIKLENADGTQDIYYSLFYEGVPNGFGTIAETELNETEERKREGIQRLQEVLKEEDIPREDDFSLLCVLRKCKYNFNKSEAQLRRYLKTQKMFADLVKAADMKKLEHVLDHLVVGILPYRDKTGRAIFFTTPNINLELFDIDDVAVIFFATLRFMLSFPLTSIVGVNYIMEAKTPTIDVLYPLTKAFQQHLGNINSIPCRIGRIEILNEISFVRWTVNLLKSFLPAKSIERISFYGGDVENLQKTYHPDLLPEEFGGTMGPLSNKVYKEELLNYIKRLKNENTI